MKLFESISVADQVLPLKEFRLFRDLGWDGESFSMEEKDVLRKQADEALAIPIPVMPVSLYREFVQNGNRLHYESVDFLRERMMLALFLGELAGGEGKYLSKLIDLMWMKLEDTTWVLPAHNNNNHKNGVVYEACPDYKAKVHNIDLFSASAGALVALIYFLMKDRFEEDFPVLLNDRILYELNRRIIEPFLDDSLTLWWTGREHNFVNNWNPWILSNILTVTALTVEDTSLRGTIADRCLGYIDNFLKGYREDGGCDEGPSYWGAAGGAFFTFLEVLYDMTGGAVSFYSLPLVKNMGEYIVKMHIQGNEYANYADCPRYCGNYAPLLKRWGTACRSETMMRFADSIAQPLEMNLTSDRGLSFHPYRTLKQFVMPFRAYDSRNQFQHEACDVLRDLEIMNLRKNGLFVSVKGGSNNESHNHNDVGNVLCYIDGEPLFFDAGVDAYTKKTFSPQRYTIWSMRSSYHNVPSFDEYEQRAGNVRAQEVQIDAQAMTMRMELRDVYQKEAGLVSCVRCAGIDSNHQFFVRDAFRLDEERTVKENFLVRRLPYEQRDGSLLFDLENGTRVQVSYSPEYVFSHEPIDVKDTRIGDNWQAEVLYRLIFSAKAKEGAFFLTAKKVPQESLGTKEGNA